MKEESHLEEMRAALRGERERAERARQRSLENVLSLVDPAPPPPRNAAPPAAPPGRLRRLFRRD
ncbi:MAG TPA: hypothetical protein VNT58_01255 [Gaiellaceae bacterium]|nr:hypothetical protein [Gaiellaceae bacterium]